jgi:triosephosphate isomerase
MKKRIVIANWKMYKPHNEAVAWCQQHQADLKQLTQSVTFGICPEFTAIAPIKAILENSNVRIGGQNCSKHEQGAYTGEVPAQSLHDIGCDICIIGHSEQRAYHHETPYEIAQKTHILREHGIQPIVCVGETENEDIVETLISQLEPVFEMLANNPHTSLPSIMIAYEPRWAIGTGKTPTEYEIQKALNMINRIMITADLDDQKIPVLYGGSVDSTSIHELKKITRLDGYLVGGASREIDELQSIVNALI